MINYWISLSPVAQSLLVLLLGLVMGSFLNVVIARLPTWLQYRWQLAHASEEIPPRPPNLIYPRSHCPACKTPIAWYDNLPVVSWLSLRGKCRHCSSRISKRYPIVEMLTAVVSVTVFWQLGSQPMTIGAWILSWYLIAASAIDLEHQLLPDSLTMGILWLGLMVNATFGWFATPTESIWGAVAGYGFFWLVFQSFFYLTGKEGLGFGDFKLLAGLGAWAGWMALPLIVFIGSLLGTIVGVILMLRHGRSKDTPLAFGPYLALGGWIVLLWGADLMAWLFPSP